MSPVLSSIVIMAFGIFSVLGSPIETRSELNSAYDFQYRFYSNGGCDHSSKAQDTWPANGSPPGQGNYSSCFSAPTGVNWNRLEVDIFYPNGNGRGIQTYCNINCQGGVSVKQQGTNCYQPVGGCAIGSFKVIT
ncbi:hypothetical protein BCR34DRAFT_560598 [Clohesyomyces aquaticus]|uniref:Uncharacterized protein n=1 Tax=Clohesyomyces aquaticus TaxID=1231657 RepID=A0A1Y1ZVM9_9PLEO|nr:hypothetical protein BCR34DRAFT_560598 [Clohesyomyces aquaticus]